MLKKNKAKSKVKKKVLKKTVSKVKKKISNKIIDREPIIKTKPEWVKNALVNKLKYQKNILTQLKKMMTFGKVKEKE